jgi:hypothetical protein
MKNYGLIESIIDIGQWFGNEAKELNLDWSKYLPVYEPQAENFETFGCTVWGTQNQLEILLKALYGYEYNFSERFNYIVANVQLGGADPHVVYESIRKTGLIDNDLLPVPSTYKEFTTPKPMTDKLLQKASEFPFTFNHWWVFYYEHTTEAQTTLIREALKVSPLGVSVSAWHLKDGVYVDKGQPNNHWCVLFSEEKGKGWKIFDSYDHSIKTIPYTHKISRCKAMSVTIKSKQSLLDFLLELLAKLKLQLPMPTPAPVPVMSNSDKLYQTAKSLIGKNLAVGMEVLGCALSMSAVYNKAFPEKPTLRFANTSQWYDFMKSSKDWVKLDKPEPDCVIVSVTGQIPKGSPLSNGHIGLVGRKASPDGTNYIMSNNSNKGYFDTHFTVKKWENYFQKYGLIPTYYFKLK